MISSKSKILILLLSLICSCSFYSLKGSIPIHLNSVVIQPTINNTSEYNIGKNFESKLTNLLIDKNLLLLTDFQKADSQLEFSIKSFNDQPYILDETSNQTSVKQWMINIVVSVVWHDLINEIDLINKEISESIVYSLDNSSIISERDNDNIDFVANRSAAIEKCIKNLSDRIINELTSTW